MNFETEYKNLNFHISLEVLSISDVSILLSDKFNRVPSRVMAELKNGSLVPYNLVIKSKGQSSTSEEERIHYWSKILLTSDSSKLLDDLRDYLNDEDILDSIVANWNLDGDESGPGWK